MTPAKVRKFQKTIWDYYRKNMRMFPWRETSDSYSILVSEIMLQQTQAGRVVDKYLQFLEAFPTFQALAEAPVSAVIVMWQGLGYNRRALSLQKLAKEVVNNHAGVLPRSYEQLIRLPGVGPATAAAIMAFAYNSPALYLETNVRSVYIHYFFPDKEKVADAELISLIQETHDIKNPREWNWAVLDYGNFLKKTMNPSRKSAAYKKQSPFKGSRRQLRGQIISLLTQHKALTEKQLRTLLPFVPTLLYECLLSLEKDGFIVRAGELPVFSLS